MRIGINTTPKHRSPEAWAKALADRGCKAASFPVDYRASLSVIDSYVKAAKDYDIVIAEVGVWNSPHVPDKKKAIKARKVCEEQFKLAEYIKARCCVNVSGAAGDIWYYCYKDNYSEWLYDENVNFIRQLCDTVNPKYTAYTIEPMQWMIPDSPEAYLKLINDIDRKGFAVHMDVINMISNPYIYTHQRELIDISFDMLGNHIRSCHLKDCRMEEGLTVAIKEVPLGKGEFDIEYYLKRINELDSEMPVLIEHASNMRAYDRALKYMKNNRYM